MMEVDNGPRDERRPTERHVPGTPQTAPELVLQPVETEDGGFQGWLQVAASFALYFNHLYVLNRTLKPQSAALTPPRHSCRGLLNSFGVFQTYYETDLLRGSSPSAISWIGSVQVFCFMAIAVIIGPLFDMGHCRSLLIAGIVFETAGFMLTSIGTSYWHILLAQGLCIGLGTCCLSIPSMAVVPLYFRRRRALAMATATVGSGLGATLYPLAFQRLRISMGFGWTMRILGFVSLATCLFALAVIKPRRRAEKPAWQDGGFTWRWLVDLSAFRDRKYLIYCVASLFSNMAFFIPSYFVQSYALSHGMRGLELASYLLPIMNSSSIPGRLVSSFVADKIGSLDTYIVVCTLSGATVLYWISVTNVPGNVSFAVLWGLFSGGFVALGNVVLTGITPDLTRLGTRLGMVSIIKGVGSLIGPPISGAILDASDRYLGVQLFSASGMLVNAMLMVGLRVVLARQEFFNADIHAARDREAQAGRTSMSRKEE